MKTTRIYALVALMMVFAVSCTKPDESNLVSGSYNGHDYVDLGLPSGILWATCNLGAEKPEDYVAPYEQVAQKVMDTVVLDEEYYRRMWLFEALGAGEVELAK